MSRVSIIGGGHVGISAAFTMFLRNTAREIVLFDRDVEKMQGEQLDFQHSLAFLAPTKIIAAKSATDTKDSNIIVFTAGISQHPGQTRLELLDDNLKILKETLPEIVKYSPQSVVLIVTNPVDILTFQADKLLGLPKGRVFGSGTSLDTARFRFHLSEVLSINTKNIHAYILGEHGDSSFPVVSSADVGGQLLTTIEGLTHEQIQDCFQKTKDAAKTIIAAKGATYYAIGVVISQLVHAVLEDSKRIFPITVPLHGEYGYSGVALSVPCVLGAQGAEKILEIPLSHEEKGMMDTSVHTLKNLTS